MIFAMGLMRQGIAVALALVSGAACSTGGRGGENEHSIQKVFVNKLRVRRPLGASVDPQAGPGGTDYRSNPLPNERLDCETLASMFSELDLGEARRCLSSLGEGTPPVSYRLRRESRPFLELKSPEDAPACLRLALPRIPVPREILFQSPEKGQYTCYSARLDLEANQTFGELRLPTNRVEVLLKFPLAKKPSDDEETIRLLGAWALTLIWGESSGGKERRLAAKIVPDRLCRRCLGDESFQKEGDPDHLLWP